MFDVFFDFFATLLSWFYELWPSYGVAIILLTVAVMLLVTPLTLKGTRSMLELQMHQPELRKIQTQYRDDRQKMNEELMKFYAEHKINPVGGCLPLLIQLPVFIILYNVIRGLTQRTSLLEARAHGRRRARPAPSTRSTSTIPPRSTRPSTSNHKMVSFGIDLARTPVQAMRDGLGTAWPYLLLVIGIAATSYVQQKQIQGRNTGQINPQMQMITRIMPIIFVFFSLNFPAGLAVYWCTSGLWRIGQQYIIGKHIYTDEAKRRLEAAKARGATITTTAKDGADAGAAAPQGGFFGRLIGAACRASRRRRQRRPRPAGRRQRQVRPTRRRRQRRPNRRLPALRASHHTGQPPAAARKRKKRK